MVAMPPVPADPRDVENQRLKKALAEALAELTATRAELAALREQAKVSDARIAELTAQVGRLTEVVAAGNDRIAELAAAANRKRKPLPPPTPKPPPTSATVAPEDRPRPPIIPPKVKPPKKPRHPTGRKPLPEHLEVDESTVTPPCCVYCKSEDLVVVDEVVEEKLTTVQAHQRRRRVHRVTCLCKQCLKLTTAEAPPAPFPRSKVTCEWLAWMVVQKFSLLVPLDRIRRHLELQGIPLSISFFVSMVEVAARLLDVVDGEHWKQLLAGSWMQTDGTSLKVIVPNLAGTHSGHLEVFCRDGTVVFQYEHDKKGETIEGKLGKYEGLLQVDAEHRYNGLFAPGRGIEEVGCNAHGFRKFEAAQAVQPVLAKEGADFLTAAFIAEGEARDADVRGEALLDWRRARIRPLYDDLWRWMDAVQPTLLPDDPLAAAIRYYRNHWGALTAWLAHSEVGPDNSAAEREFQTVAKARLSWLFAGSTEGAHRAATLLGVVATCRNLGVDIEAYLTWAFVRLGTHRAKFNLPASQLTPAAYKAQLGKPPPDQEPDG
jgi:transposase